MKDFLDREFTIGDKVVYPGRTGSSMWLNYGIIRGIGKNHLRVCLIKSGDVKILNKEVTVVRTDRVVIV